jgi:Flp pilus assembly protein TadG
MRHDRGAATAELVMVLPVLVAVVLGLTWLLSLGVAQVRTVDAARETARALARGDDTATAITRGEQVGPARTSVAVTRGDGQVSATATAEVRGPGGLFGFLPAVHLHAVAVAAAEDDS